jgi:lysozyme
LKTLINQLKEDEGFSATPYKCTAGHLTIGYGANLDAGITEEEAESMLQVRVDIVNCSLEKEFPGWYNDLDWNKQNAIINMVYNLGLQESCKLKKMIHCLEIKDYPGAVIEMLQSEWAKRVGKRADRLAKIMKSVR